MITKAKELVDVLNSTAKSLISPTILIAAGFYVLFEYVSEYSGILFIFAMVVYMVLLISGIVLIVIVYFILLHEVLEVAGDDLMLKRIFVSITYCLFCVTALSLMLATISAFQKID